MVRVIELGHLPHNPLKGKVVIVPRPPSREARLISRSEDRTWVTPLDVLTGRPGVEILKPEAWARYGLVRRERDRRVWLVVIERLERSPDHVVWPLYIAELDRDGKQIFSQKITFFAAKDAANFANRNPLPYDPDDEGYDDRTL